MKHIKTFESFSINEEEGVWGDFKSFAGIEDNAEVMKRKEKFLADLQEIEKEVEGSTNVVFNKESLVKQAKDNSYRGKLEIAGSRTGNNVVVYKVEHTGLEKLAKVATPTSKQSIA
jgi:hypothetical protein